MNTKPLQTFLIVLGIAVLALLFIVKDQAGDIDSVYWRFGVTKQHLLSEASFPYFTPARCGGFHLAADAHDLIFTPYMAVSFLVPNPIWNVKITNFLLSLFFWAGMYFWLGRLGVLSSIVRIYVGLLMAISGYWICHMSQAGHVWGAGLAYMPWILLLADDLFDNRFNARKFLGLTFLLFLLINSGYYWFQVGFPILACRLIVGMFPIAVKNLRNCGIFILAGAYAIFLSLARLIGIYVYQMEKFPRLGGETPYFQVIGDTPLLFKSLFSAFFDPRIITNAIHSAKMLGYWYDYSAYMGMLSVVFIAIGMWVLLKKGIFSNRSVLALILASIIQLAILRTTHAIDLVCSVFPFLKQITWYWRGNAIFTLFFGVLIAFGLSKILESQNRWLARMILALMFLNIVDIAYTHIQQIRPAEVFTYKEIFRDKFFPPKPFNYIHDNVENCNLGYLFGYNNILPSQLSFRSQMDVHSTIEGGYYNIHDVRQLACKEADGGVYLKDQWPLWPASDKALMDRFVNYEQVVDGPPSVKIAQVICALAWALLAIWTVVALRQRRKIE